MIIVRQEELHAALQQLDQAIYSHQQWHKDLTRTLVCRLPHDQRDVAQDAHRQCRFGQWYYHHAAPGLRGYPAFIAMDGEHERMHQLAARLLNAAAVGTAVSQNDYDNFANALDRLRLQIDTMKRELEDSLYNRDPTTGAESRIGMLTKLRELLEMVRRHVQHCCIAIMDLDHFKAVNDAYGHLTGDAVLAGSVRYLLDNLRPYDKVFRYGGEEFLLALQNTDQQTAQALIERLREGLASAALTEASQGPIRVTASFGITLLDPDVSVEVSIERADKALYEAKASGRNRVCLWDASK
jgi:diguanylate cyclase (GGDEF)-like protein